MAQKPPGTHGKQGKRGQPQNETADCEPKTCVVCGRTMEWRKAWEKNWDSVTKCSKACRKRGRKPIDDTLEAAISDLLDQRARTATICPSEAARAVAAEMGSSDDDPEAWRALMEPTRAAARRLVARGEVEITQKGRVVDPSTAKGPIRIRRA